MSAAEARREPVVRFPSTLPEKGPTAEERPAPPPRRNAETRIWGPIGSLAIHLAVLLLLLLPWWSRPKPQFHPIAVHLVMLPPPKPPPRPKPPAPKAPPRGMIASQNMGPVLGKRAPGQSATPSPKPERAPPQLAAGPAMPPPREEPLLRKPDWATMTLPKPSVVIAPVVRRFRAAIPEGRARYPGPSATRNAYLAYCNMLIRRHIAMVPRSLVGSRQGTAIIHILVFDDGKIAEVSIAQSSGYPDIDRRVEAMVAAVGRFPPIPQWFQGQEMALRFVFPFPGAFEE